MWVSPRDEGTLQDSAVGGSIPQVCCSRTFCAASRHHSTLQVLQALRESARDAAGLFARAGLPHFIHSFKSSSGSSHLPGQINSSAKEPVRTGIAWTEQAQH